MDRSGAQKTARTKTQRAKREVRYQALYDPLTHLPNRRCLFKTLNAEVRAVKGSLGKGTLAVVDIDFL
ncbi:GGDEF domain-containing protein [Vibrio lentus]|nr:GGDEF domain-containing protein [Vibrio lentus]